MAGTIASFATGSIGAIAVLGIFLSLIVTGNLHTNDSVRMYKQTIADLKETIKEKDKAIAAAGERADAAVKASELIANAMARAPERRGSHAP